MDLERSSPKLFLSVVPVPDETSTGQGMSNIRRWPEGKTSLDGSCIYTRRKRASSLSSNPRS